MSSIQEPGLSSKRSKHPQKAISAVAWMHSWFWLQWDVFTDGMLRKATCILSGVTEQDRIALMLSDKQNVCRWERTKRQKNIKGKRSLTHQKKTGHGYKKCIDLFLFLSFFVCFLNEYIFLEDRTRIQKNVLICFYSCPFFFFFFEWVHFPSCSLGHLSKVTLYARQLRKDTLYARQLRKVTPYARQLSKLTLYARSVILLLSFFFSTPVLLHLLWTVK